MTWHFAGPVTGYYCDSGEYDCGIGKTLDEVVPLGTMVDVVVSFDADFPSYPAPGISCISGVAT